MKNFNRDIWIVSLSLFLASAGIVSCSRGGHMISGKGAASAPAPAMIPSAQGPQLTPQSIPPGTTQAVKLDNGAMIAVQNIAGTLYHKVEGTMTPEAFSALSANLAGMPKADRDAQMARELKSIREDLRQSGALGWKEVDEVAYFSFFAPYTPALLSSVKGMRFKHALALTPVTFETDPVPKDRDFTLAAEGIAAGASTARFSGLERIHAPEFVKAAEADIGTGEKVNGSSVALGVTDTGLTLNHPTFRSAIDGHNRIEYLKDFGREGRMYFSPGAAFKVSVPESGTADDLVLDAQVIETPKLPTMPFGDQPKDVKGLKIKVSPELRQILTQPGSGGAKLGVLSEETMNGKEETVDINGNGKIDDKLWAILVPGSSPEKDSLYFDTTGTGDFRRSPALHDWTTTKTAMVSSAETIGFHIQEDELPKSTDSKAMVMLRSASIVGYDPGNHGSHVTGIAAGSKTIANDPDDTLARGVAPEARILLNRVCTNNGGCQYVDGFVDMAINGKADVINMSLGSLSPFNDGYSVAETMINRLTSVQNTLFVISAGNSGPGHQTVGDPSTARLSLSVGATATRGMIQKQYEWPGDSSLDHAAGDDQDFVLFFSSRGPTAAGGFKPNVTAPGTELSSVQLNSAPGSHAGLDVYWGTSMAAPTATGAYALFLDAIRKYNKAHPDRKLSTNSMTLRSVLIASARPFDAHTFEPATGVKSAGHYTWMDQGKGMIDLLAAWQKIKEVRDDALPSSVTHNGTPVELDYQVLVKTKSINGIPYDGSRIAAPETPALGTGIYLDFKSTDTLQSVMIARRLPEALASGSDAGDLKRQLETTKDEFVLKTRIYGSDVEWLRAGTQNRLNCWESPTSNFTVLSTGVEIGVDSDGKAVINGQNASDLNICINRDAVAHQLPQGDNGALIEAYRVAGGKVASIPSFTVPVYVTVPHQILGNSTGYAIEREIHSFEVNRNYVTIPPGTRMAKITLEVPPLKISADGQPSPGEECSGVELMALLGKNTSTPYKTRPEARITNCTDNGSVVTDPAKRRLTFSTLHPTAGVWDLDVFGLYAYAHSKFSLKVDYVNAATSLDKIEGNATALNGSLKLTIQDTSLAVAPDSAKSSYALNGLFASTGAQVATDAHAFVPSATGQLLRKYPAEIASVTLTTGNSPGNDIDLTVLECAASATAPDDSSCSIVGASGGPTADESAKIKPKADKLYAVRVDGYDIEAGDGKFSATETLELPEESGTVTVNGSGTEFQIGYGLSAGQIASSKLLKDDLFVSGKYDVVGALKIRSDDGTALAVLPVQLKH